MPDGQRSLLARGLGALRPAGSAISPGFGLAQAFMGVNLDNRAFGGLYVGVCMGRHAGFLTAASALGRRSADDGPHLIYLPERPFDIERFTEDVW